MDWDEVLRRVAGGEDVEAVLDERSKAETNRFAEYMREIGQPGLADSYLAKIKEIDSGIEGARNTWHSLSEPQRAALELACEGVRFVRRPGRATVFDAERGGRQQPAGVRYPTIRNLCERDLLAWDGGAFKPGDAAVVTERGRFVVAHGQPVPA